MLFLNVMLNVVLNVELNVVLNEELHVVMMLMFNVVLNVDVCLRSPKGRVYHVAAILGRRSP